MPVDTSKREAESLLSEISYDCPPQFANKEGFALVAFETAIFETAVSSNRYDYTAVNINSGKSERIDRRRKPYQRTDEDIFQMLRKLKTSRVAGKARLEVDSDTSLPLSQLREVMYAVFREVLPQYGFPARNGQIELAEKILEAVANRGTLLAEAAVGIGKTLAYMVIAILIKRSRLNEHWNTASFPGMSVVEWKRMPVVVSTSSISLQHAIINDVIPVLSEILLSERVIKEPIQTVLVKGKGHYICEQNLRAYMPYEKKSNIKAVLERLAIDDSQIDLAETPSLPTHVKNKIRVPERCCKNCPDAKFCRYRSFRDSIKTDNIDVIVTNHNLLLMDAKLRAEGNCSILPPYQLLVLDEAHEFLQAARSTFGNSLSIDAVRDITRAIHNMDFVHEDKNTNWREIRSIITQLANMLHRQNKRLFAIGDTDAVCDTRLAAIHDLAGELIYDLKKSGTFKNKLSEECKISLLRDLERLRKSVTALGSCEENIRWLETNKVGNTSLCSLPKNLHGIIRETLWKRGVPTLLTSGTLSVAGNFDALKLSLGLNSVKKLYETTQVSPYDYRKNALLYISENVPYYKDSGYLTALTDEVERLILAANGHTAVLFTSYSVMNKVFDALEKRGLSEVFSFFKLERASSDAIDRFKKSKEQKGRHGVLFASGALWEGIDIPGDALSSLIIVKLPFAVPDAVSEFERKRYSSGYEYLNKVLVPEMLIKLKQGFGRLIRAMTDTGVVAILDCRVGKGGTYRERTLFALPDCPVTSEIVDVEAFLKLVKTLEYWG